MSLTAKGKSIKTAARNLIPLKLKKLMVPEPIFAATKPLPQITEARRRARLPFIFSVIVFPLLYSRCWAEVRLKLF